MTPSSAIAATAARSLNAPMLSLFEADRQLVATLDEAAIAAEQSAIAAQQTMIATQQGAVVAE